MHYLKQWGWKLPFSFLKWCGYPGTDICALESNTSSPEETPDYTNTTYNETKAKILLHWVSSPYLFESAFICFVLCAIMQIATISIIEHTQAPVLAVIILINFESVVSPNAASIAVSRDNIDTSADAKLICLTADSMGLWYFRYFTILMIAIVKAVNVYAAIAIVII